jgi:hypothetical protein
MSLGVQSGRCALLRSRLACVAFFYKQNTITSMTLTLPSHSFLTEAGQSVDMFPVSSDLTVAQAAALLDMSEACVNELLDNDILKFRQESGERLLLRTPLLAYKERCEFRSVGLAEMVRWDQEMGLYDD